MERIFLNILFISFLLISLSCRERNDLTGNGNDPTIGGEFTEIEGIQSGMLTSNKSPFYVSGNLTISAEDTLIIQRGVELFFKNYTRLIVNGVLKVEGTKIEPVRFTSFEYDWEGIHIINSAGNSSLAFSVFENIYLPIDSIWNNGAIEINNSTVEIRNCYFQNNLSQYGGGLGIINSNVTLINNIFFENAADLFGGAIYSEGSSNEIINNTFYKNICYNYGGGFVIADPINEEIQNNIFFDNFSYRGDQRIDIISGDSSNIHEEFNFLAFGTMNPLFISEENLHLQQTSPCIDNGNPSIEFNDADGTRNDQGAYGGPGGDW